MKRLIAILAVGGALWMALVISRGSIVLAVQTNYLGMSASRFVQYKAIAPSSTTVLMFNVWLVLTSALEWVIMGLLLRGVFLRLRGLTR